MTSHNQDLIIFKSMSQYDILKIPNQGNIIANLRLLYEMKNSGGDYIDANGYYSKRDIAEIAANALLITSGTSVGRDVVEKIDSKEKAEGDNSPLQNAKMRMQLLRILGLVSADYDSETYAITEMGERLLEQVFSSSPNYSLLRELFMGVCSSSESYNHNCDLTFECYIGYEICYAFAKLDYKISTFELTTITTYSKDNIPELIADIKDCRSKNIPLPEDHPHAPRTQKGALQKNPANLTRSINQILRICGIIEHKQLIENVGGRRISYYVCTDAGKHYVDSIAKQIDKGELNFLHPAYFRKANLLQQRDYCIKGLSSIYYRSGLDSEGDGHLVFSPYQLLPEASVSWFLGKPIRRHPVKSDAKVSIINSQITAQSLRLKAKYSQSNGETVRLLSAHEILIREILDAKDAGQEKEKYIDTLINTYYDADKSTFYPFVHSLLRIIGLDCRGEVGRYDGYSLLGEHIIPVEIKSRTETPCYNLKGLRQAVENKICSYKDSITEDIDYSSLVVGFEHPSSMDDIMTFIESAKEKLQIRIVATDIRTLISMCIRVVWDNMMVDLNDIFKGYGVLSE